jgi:hypothetical protein
MHGELARRSAAALGALSVASGALLVLAPEEMAERYALPRNARLCKALGVRDVAIGFVLRSERHAALGCVLRACADAGDACLIAIEVGTGRRTLEEARVPLAGALALVASSARLFTSLNSAGRPFAR